MRCAYCDDGECFCKATLLTILFGKSCEKDWIWKIYDTCIVLEKMLDKRKREAKDVLMRASLHDSGQRDYEGAHNYVNHSYRYDTYFNR